MKALLGDRDESRPTGRVANFGFQLHPRRVDRIALTLQRAEVPRLVDAERPPCNDARSHREETDEHDNDGGARAEPVCTAPPGLVRHAAYASCLRQALSLALRERGFLAVSVSAGATARRVSVSPNECPRQVQTGCLGGHTQSELHSRNACFTSRSSPE